MNHFTQKTINISKTPENQEIKAKKSPSSDHKAFQTSLFRRVLRYIPKNKTEYRQKKVPFFLLMVTFLLATVIIGKATFTIYEYVTTFSFSDMLGIFSSDLKKDQQGKINLLLLGNGGGTHNGADLTDTIMIASIDQSENTATLLSLPRDLWLVLPGYDPSRINKMYENLKTVYGSEQALDILRKGVENISNISIPYVVRIDFQGFIKVIDRLGGIQIEVEKSIYDTEYPNEDETGYETFSLEAGLQEMDGETALKYARSRHSTSDFDRAERQHKLLTAIREKAEEKSVMSSPLLIKRILGDITENLETNMSIPEMVSLARFAKSFDSKDLTSLVLRDSDILDTGSFLYTPEREIYGGAFVLLPQGNSYERIQQFMSIAFHYPKFFSENSTIQILNGTKQYGLAARLGEKLIPYGFSIENYENADRKDYSTSHYYINHPEKTQWTEKALKLLFPTMIQAKGPIPKGVDTTYDISIIVGEDTKTESL